MTTQRTFRYFNMSIEKMVAVRRHSFYRHVALYENITLIDMNELIKKINDKDMLYNKLKNHVYRKYNVMMYPKLCFELHKTRESVCKSRESVMELLIDNLMEMFKVYEYDKLDNI